MQARTVERIISDKIMPGYLKDQVKEFINGDDNVNAKKYNDMIIHFKAAERVKDNCAFRPIYSHRKYIGRIIVFVKKVIRKSLKWYIEPICFQQSMFNNNIIKGLSNSSNVIKGLLETNSMLLKEIEELKVKIEQLEKQKQ